MVLALSFVWNLAVVLFCVVSVALILIVLLQKGRGGGLSGAFGGAGAGSLLGTKTGDVLTWITICLVALFLVMAVLIGKFMRPETSSDLSLPMTNQAPMAPVTTEDVTATVDEAAATAEAEAVVEDAVNAADEAAGEAEEVEVPADQM